MTTTHKEQLIAMLLAHKEDEQIQASCTVLAEFNYRNSIMATVEQLWQQVDKAALDLLLIDSDLVNTEQLAKIKKALSAACPILILAEPMEEEQLTAYLNQGADDFIVKPVNPVLLKAKLRSLAKSRHSLRQQLEDCRHLSAYQQLVEQEQAVAVNLYENILRVNYLETAVVKSVVSARSLFNGDIVLVGRTPDNRLHVLLGDFSGYGISAYVAAAPTAEIFYGMTAKGFDITEIAQEINRKLYQLLPRDMFLSAAIVGLYSDTKTLHVLNCGMPEQVLMKRTSNSFKTIASNNLPLGIIGGDADLQLQSFEIGGKDYLYLLTRAVGEAKNRAGQAFGDDAVRDCIRDHDGSAFEGFLHCLQQHCGNERVQNEITFVELFCDVEHAPWKCDEIEQQYSPIEPLSWKTMMEFDISTLRKLNPVPIIVNALMELQGLQQHRQTIFLIVTELFANALDHGVLKLDSAIKQTPEGFMRFYELREQRLNTSTEGHIRILFEHRPTDSGGQLIIKVKDSGDGFIHTAAATELDVNFGFSGRGIALMKSLCSRITYQGRGNRVTVVFDWAH